MRSDATSTWFTPFVSGLLIIGIGVAALIASGLTALASIYLLGGFIAVGGIAEILHAFRVRRGGPFMLHLVSGVLACAAGVFVLTRPVGSLEVVTLGLAVYFMLNGAYRVASALSDRLRHWGLNLVLGILSVAFGAVLAVQWPGSSLRLIGAFVGLEIIARGISVSSAALTQRRSGHALSDGSEGSASDVGGGLRAR